MSSVVRFAAETFVSAGERTEHTYYVCVSIGPPRPEVVKCALKLHLSNFEHSVLLQAASLQRLLFACMFAWHWQCTATTQSCLLHTHVHPVTASVPLANQGSGELSKFCYAGVLSL